MNYRGRFAPSPSGPLHFGSLVAALGSYLDARKQQGKWLVRIEDIDPPREKKGAVSQILHTLEAFGFEWDESILYQSQRLSAYQEALDQLFAKGVLYECTCSRKEINAAGQYGSEGIIYPGTCRLISTPSSATRKPKAVRLMTTDHPVAFTDRVMGHQSQLLASDIGDFVLKRADGLFAYQLAVVVDDAYQGITDVVRGADLLTSTPRQIYLQNLLALPTPTYKHLPLVVDENGHKLSKQSQSQPVVVAQALPALKAAWVFLGQTEADEPLTTVSEFWEWSIAHWDYRLIHK
ncbi:MAG: tRNA glutamyl-Q(34) synthetase GluQRS [Sedimenticola sp.]|nr:tRNA glutamyl-Q(34) synthetase GluQRS [Sedimenticola sp.]